jgi:DNA-directed RNA polymerase subunit M
MSDGFRGTMKSNAGKDARIKSTGLEFCPTCKKILSLDLRARKLRCGTCGYERSIMETKLYSEKTLKPKQTLILGPRDISNAHTRKKVCPECGNDEAYFWMHGRSKENAPEPSNRFYKCTRCGHAWKEI